MIATQWVAVLGVAVVLVTAVPVVLVRFSDRPSVWVPAFVAIMAASVAACWVIAHNVGTRTDSFRKGLAVAEAVGLFVGASVGATVGGFRDVRQRQR